MSRHDVRPRVYPLVAALGTFTEEQLRREANLKDRNQAYTQIKHLTDEGFLEKEQLSPKGPYRPITLYRLTSNAKKRMEFIERAGAYSPKRAKGASEGVVLNVLIDALIHRISQSLVETETELHSVEGALRKNEESKETVDWRTLTEQLSALDAPLRTVKIDLETALLEAGNDVSEEATPEHPVIIEVTRWRRALAQRDALQRRIQTRETQKTTVALVNEAAKAIAGHVGPPRDHWLRKALHGFAGRAVVEAFVDRLYHDPTDRKGLVAQLINQAWRAGDPEVLLACLDLWTVRSLGWRVNRASAKLLCNRREDAYKDWVETIATTMSRPPHHRLSTGVYLCEKAPSEEEAYLEITKNSKVSLVSPTVIDYLAAVKEVIRPAMVDLARESDAKATKGLLSTGPMEHWHFIGLLYGYGPIIEQIQSFPGAPAMRVAASFADIGAKKEAILKIAGGLTEQKTLLVVQPKTSTNTRDLSKLVSDACGTMEEVALV